MKIGKYSHYVKGRVRTIGQNRTESKYAQELELEKKSGEILWYAFEGIKLRLADNTFYTPDFFVMKKDGTLECHEVKGFWEDDARVKIKVAAEHFPFRFIAIKYTRQGMEEEIFE